MFSPFRGRKAEDSGTGGKAIRTKRRALPALPYARPENLLPAPEPENGNPKWFSGFISGAGRLISSVFRSESEESSSSSSSEDGEDRRHFSDEEENDNGHTENFQQLHETAEGSSLEIQWSERKLAIKRLLLQETFSRDESNALVAIIQSRIVDSIDRHPELGEGMEIYEKSAYKDLNFLGTWRSLNKGKKFPEGLEYQSNYMIEHPGYTQDLCEKAVMEAKQWLDKKRLECTPKTEPDLGPCTLNTERKWEDGDGSPIDIARSYMKTRPPWKSPIMRSIGSKSPPGFLPFDEVSPSIRADMMSPASLEPTKRSYLYSEADDSKADISYHDAHQNIDDIDSTAGIVSSVSIEPSKLLDAPGTPENSSLDYGRADMASISPGRGAALVNITTTMPHGEACKSTNSLQNGQINSGNEWKNEGNNPCSTSQIPDLKLESTSTDAPNFILINDKGQEPAQALKEVASTTSEESSAARRGADNMQIGIKQYQRSPKSQTKHNSTRLRSQQSREGQRVEPVNGLLSDTNAGTGEERNPLAAENGNSVHLTVDIPLATQPVRRSGRPRRVAVNPRRGRGRGRLGS